MKCNNVTVIGIIKSVIYGLTYLMVSDILEKISNFDLLAYRFLAAAITFELFRLLRIIKIDLKGKNIWPLIGIALLQPVYYIFQNTGLSKTSSLTAGIIGSLSSVFILILEAFILKEHANWKQKLFLFLSTGGVLLITALEGGGEARNSLTGIFLLLLAVLVDGLFTVLTRKNCEKFTPVEITYVLMIFMAAVFNVINAARRLWIGELQNYFTPLLDFGVLWRILYLGVLASAVAYLIFASMVSQMQASSSSVFSGVSTVVSIIAGVLFRHETFFWYHAIGTVMILLGVWGVGRFKNNSFLQEKTRQISRE